MTLKELENAILDLAKIQNNQIKLLGSVIELLKINSDLLLKIAKKEQLEEIDSSKFDSYGIG